MAPRYAPYGTFSFSVTDEGYAGPLEVDFTPPASVDGSLDAQVSASARNVSAGSGLVLHLRNSSLSVSLDLSMVESPPTAFTCTIPAMLPLADYELWLTVESGGTAEWSSPVTALTVEDETPPVFHGHSATEIGPELLLVEVNCSDAYGVLAVVATSREKGSPGSTADFMTLASGDARNGSWSVVIRITSPNTLEYNFTAADAGQSVSDPPGGDMYEYDPVEVPEFPVAPAVLAAVGLLVGAMVVNRARRP